VAADDELWFDFVSAESYLAFRRADLEPPASRPKPCPVSLRGLFEATGTSGLPFTAPAPPAKARYLELAQARAAAIEGVALTAPLGHPLDTSLALRVALVGPDAWPVARALFDAYWLGRALDQPQVIARVLDEGGFDGHALLEAAQRERNANELAARTSAAVETGLFDLPTTIHRREGRHELAVGFTPAPQPNLRSGGAAKSVLFAATKAIDFYFDYASPFAYLAATQLPRVIAHTGAEVTLRPLLLGGLFRSLGTANVPLFAMSDAKRQYQLQHLTRAAAEWQVPFRFATRFPMNTVKALRLTTLAPPERQLELALAIFTAFWADDRDISSDEVLLDVVEKTGVDQALLGKLDDSATKQRLREATDAASALGIFGVPTIIYGSQPFWGQDNIELVARLLGAATNATAR